MHNRADTLRARVVPPAIRSADARKSQHSMIVMIPMEEHMLLIAG